MRRIRDLWSAARLRRSLACGGVAAALASCADNPFVRVNPNDPEAGFTMTVTASTDSTSVVGDTIVFTAALAPPSPGYVPAWSSSNPALRAVAPGRFVVDALPATIPSPVLVTARFAKLTASASVTLWPADP
jgi:hypothetical protein